MQRDVGPGALLRLIGGALRLDATTFRNAVAESGRTRLYLAVVLLAAIVAAFATAMEAVGAGLMRENEVALYRVFVIGWGLAVVVQFTLFVGAVWLIGAVARRPKVGFAALARLLALSLAPCCLLFLGPVIGQPEIVTGLVTLWRWAIAVMGLRVGVEASWLGAIVTVLASDWLTGPIARLVMLGFH